MLSPVQVQNLLMRPQRFDNLRISQDATPHYHLLMGGDIDENESLSDHENTEDHSVHEIQESEQENEEEAVVVPDVI